LSDTFPMQSLKQGYALLPSIIFQLCFTLFH